MEQNLLRDKSGKHSFGRKFSWEKFLGASFGEFFWEQLFWGRKFWEGKFLGGILQVKFHSGKKRILGSKKVFERKDTGSNFLGTKIVSGGKIW